LKQIATNKSLCPGRKIAGFCYFRYNGRVVGKANAALKRIMDVVGASAALCAGAPVLVAVAAAVRWRMGRPVLFRQERAGRNGQRFTIYKFRTMREPDATSGPGATTTGDADRLTSLGAFLRASSLDELPELFNVLAGTMSLVGPRPLLAEYLSRYTPEQARRHQVKPGITGWAQINGRNALTWEQKFALDCWYVDHQSLWLDLRILAKTALYVVIPQGIAHDGEATMPVFMGTGKGAVP
jgi:lipopolysaccharide/colanic/teichoic acid biosynthesis glycosyltransferase